MHNQCFECSAHCCQGDVASGQGVVSNGVQGADASLEFTGQQRVEHLAASLTHFGEKIWSTAADVAPECIQWCGAGWVVLQRGDGVHHFVTSGAIHPPVAV